jgi:hypothetical protein
MFDDEDRFGKRWLALGLRVWSRQVAAHPTTAPSTRHACHTRAVRPSTWYRAVPHAELRHGKSFTWQHKIAAIWNHGLLLRQDGVLAADLKCHTSSEEKAYDQDVFFRLLIVAGMRKSASLMLGLGKRSHR